MPDVPAGAKRPADHKPAKAEARSEPIEVDFEGEHYVIDRENADNLELFELVEDEKYLSAIRGFLGAEQWSKWKDAHRDDQGRVRSASFEPFLDAVMVAIGGNSSASPTS